MRKLIVWNMLSLDGFFEGTNKEIDWHVVDGEFNDLANEQLLSVDLIIFGRVTYQLMASYWPTPAGRQDDPIIADKMNRWPKLVFSRSLDQVDWENTRLYKGDIVEEITRLKALPGKDMIIFGSGSLVTQLTQAHAIDEYRFGINPVILGSGKPMFAGLQARLPLKLLRARTLRSGVVILYYLPQ
jgi:dihydrofolate reductase